MSNRRIKSQIRGVGRGDRKAISQWFSFYSVRIYTWIVYRFSIESSAAIEPVKHLFLQALEQWDQYDPKYLSMLQWFRELAEQNPISPETRSLEGEVDIGLWTAIQIESLELLAGVAGRDLPEEILQKPTVVHLIRAAFSDLNEDNQYLLLRKYHKLDSEAELEAQLNDSVHSVPDALVRARHEFRRSLAQWIRKINPDVGESAPDARMAVYEINLEKIFRSMDPYLRIPERNAESIVETLVQRARQLDQERSEGKGVGFGKWAVVGLVAIVLAGGGIVYLLNREDLGISDDMQISSGSELQSEMIEPVEPRDPVKEVISEEEMKQQLMEAFAAGKERNLEELIRILSEASYPAQITAAHFLGMYGDASAINPLEQAAKRWNIDPKQENLFLRAIDQIEQRLVMPPVESVTEEENAGVIETDLSIMTMPVEEIAGEEAIKSVTIIESHTVEPNQTMPVKIQDPNFPTELKDPNETIE